MVDLQRSMGCIRKTVRVWIQAGRKNSDTGAPPAPVLSETFSRRDSGENFIRADLTQLEPRYEAKNKIWKTTPCKGEIEREKRSGILT